MELTHVHAFLDAMQRKDLEAMLLHMADDVVLKRRSSRSLRGKSPYAPSSKHFWPSSTSLTFAKCSKGPEHVAQYFNVTVGTNELDGMDYWRLNEEGLIAEMTVLWRPLPAIVEVQKKTDRLKSASSATLCGE